jgi:Na+/H+-dicarboxylate symporter
MLAKVVVVYGSVLGVVVTIQAIYLGLYYFLAARFDLTRWVSMLRQVAPAAIAGFSTMSSASAMPISMIAAEKNTGDPAMARAIVPASVNIHTLGSALALTILAMTTLKTFGMELPSLELAIRFSAYYALAKFAVAAVPGGAVLVAAPLLESFFGFTPDMTAIFTAVYTFFDPFSTAGNVLGNGAFAVLFNDTFKFFRRTPEEKKAVEA